MDRMTTEFEAKAKVALMTCLIVVFYWAHSFVDESSGCVIKYLGRPPDSITELYPQFFRFLIGILIGVALMYIFGNIIIVFFRIFGVEKDPMRQGEYWFSIISGAGWFVGFLGSGLSLALFGFSDTWYLQFGYMIFLTVFLAGTCLLCPAPTLAPTLNPNLSREFTYYSSYVATQGQNSISGTSLVRAVGDISEETKKRLPQHVANIVLADAISKNEVCPISNDPIIKETATVTSCGHVFCKDAIDCWLSVKDECPVCKQKCT